VKTASVVRWHWHLPTTQNKQHKNVC